jgi:hypothetical protein
MLSKRDGFLMHCKMRVCSPYIWGGQSDLIGYDCSGFVVANLWREGVDIDDMSSSGLASYFKYCRRYTPVEGAIAFYGRDTEHISHCMVVTTVWDNGSYGVVGARGGNSTTTSLDVAAQQKACIGAYVDYWQTGIQFFSNPWHADGSFSRGSEHTPVG